MNLTIPIMKGQTATVSVYDNVNKELYTWVADHRRVSTIRSTPDKKSVTCFQYEAVMADENVRVKGVGRNKKMCRTSIDLSKLNDTYEM
jgi:hypothetical protein